MGVHGLWLSVVQAVVIVMCSQGFIAMPITFGSLPFDLAFFTGGILAKRNNWLDTIHNMERKLVWAYRTRAVSCRHTKHDCRRRRCSPRPPSPPPSPSRPSTSHPPTLPPSLHQDYRILRLPRRVRVLWSHQDFS